MYYIQGFVVILATCLTYCISQWDEEKQALSGTEMQSDFFRQLLERANEKCNLVLNETIWYKQESIIGGSKQVQGPTDEIYEFSLRQRGTNCLRKDMLKISRGRTSQACFTQDINSEIICRVGTWHNPKTNTSVVQVREIWMIKNGDKVIAETVQVINETEHGLDRALIEDAIMNLNNYGRKPKLFKYSRSLEITLQLEGASKKTLKVFLVQTNCTNERNSKRNFKHLRENCFSQMTGTELVCDLYMNRANFKQPRFSGCTAARERRPINLCNANMGNSTNMFTRKTMKIYSMKNFARSDVRFLSTEEIHEQPFQDLLKTVMRRYNSGSFSDNVSKAIKVENAHVESGPNVITKFTLWAQETPCKKQSNLLMNDDNFATVCKIHDELPIKRPAETCDVKVTKVDPIGANGQIIELRNYKFIPNYNLSLYKEMQYVQRGTAEDKIKMKIAKRIVERYNTERNDLYEYKLESVQNAKWMISAGRLFSMNVTMKAFACKNKNDISCANLLKEMHLYRHCEASALDRPWPFKEAINFTNCWKEIVLRQSVKGVWSFLSPRELSQLQNGEMFKSLVKKYRDSSMVLGQMKSYQLSGGSRLTVSETQFISLKLQLKGTKQNESVYECEVAVVQQKGKPNERYLHRCIWRPPFPDNGNQRAGSKKIPDDQQRKWTFQSKLRSIVEQHNNISSDGYYHRLFDIEEPVTKGDPVVLTSFRVYLQQTRCQKNKYNIWHAEKVPHLCGRLNNTHTTSCVANIFENPSNTSIQFNLQDCKVSKMANPIRVQSTSDDLQASTYFRELLSNAVLAFNLKSDAKLLYHSHLVEAVVRSRENPNNLHFTLTLSQTSCRKWEDVLAFRLDRNELCHTDLPASHLVLCKVDIVEFDKRTEINLDNCKYTHGGDYTLSRPQNGRERSTPLFQQVVQNAVSLFNHQTDSEYWFNLVAIENPKIEHVFGIQYTFTLHMLPAQCLIIRSPAGTAEYVSQEYCNYTRPEFMVSCRARFWRRAWNDLHETLDVSDCDLIPISHTWSATIENTNPVKERSESNAYCLESIAQRLVELFAEQQNLGQPYETVSIENIVEYLVPGKRLTFDLYIKIASKTQKCSFNDAQKCGVKKQFFKCQASYWWKDWKEQETVELFNCITVSSKEVVHSVVKGVSAVDDPSVEELCSKAVGIYNKKMAKFYIFGKERIDNVTHKTDAGKLTRFKIVLKPTGCKFSHGDRHCEPKLSKLRASCSVTVLQRPWMEDREVSLQNCHEYFLEQSDLDSHPLTEEEADSDTFRDAIRELVGMYRWRVPIGYTLDTYENAKVRRNETDRIVTLTLTLQPAGCIYYRPNSNDPACLDWKYQDKVKCDAEIIQQFRASEKRTLRLKGCSPIREPMKKRALQPEEYKRSTVVYAIKEAWKQFHENFKEPYYLYNVLDVRDGTIERDEHPRITFTLTFEQTACIRGVDDYKFEGVRASLCYETTPKVLKNCTATVTVKEPGPAVELICQTH
ncbi:hypothetical protein CRM22_000136 [Opisthorchis felineus]|uniref:Cystatin domain-containing protein n=1 Tax=Opisthorchis felineus TaxID=147828 RepID=A0A4S2MMW5_OPIFE|nr:hypothetical protein CRM22_000136 [Opisthorchis felineus]